MSAIYNLVQKRVQGGFVCRERQATNLRHHSNGLVSVVEAKALCSQGALADAGVQLCKAIRELYFQCVYLNRAEGVLALLTQLGAYEAHINRKELPNLGSFKLQVPRHYDTVAAVNVNVLHAAKEPSQHVEEMHSDVGG